jgi:hypothetical protein
MTQESKIITDTKTIISEIIPHVPQHKVIETVNKVEELIKTMRLKDELITTYINKVSKKHITKPKTRSEEREIMTLILNGLHDYLNDYKHLRPRRHAWETLQKYIKSDDITPRMLSVYVFKMIPNITMLKHGFYHDGKISRGFECEFLILLRKYNNLTLHDKKIKIK